MYQILNIQNTHFYMLSSEVDFFFFLKKYLHIFSSFSVINYIVQFIILQSLGFQHPSKVLGI